MLLKCCKRCSVLKKCCKCRKEFQKKNVANAAELFECCRDVNKRCKCVRVPKTWCVCGGGGGGGGNLRCCTCA